MNISIILFIKSIAPKYLVNILKLRRKEKIIKKHSIENVFTTYHKDNYWNSEESLSGRGSELNYTQNLIIELEKLFDKFEIKSILDIPCGDFNWMKEVDLTNINYIGADIVDSLIFINNSKYSNVNINFNKLDLTKDELPSVNLIICRDCLVHLPFAEIMKALKNIKKSKSKYLLTTSFINRKENKDILIGEWRPLNLNIKPFNLPTALKKVDEKCAEGNGKYNDKHMLLWEVDKINISFRLKFYSFIYNCFK